MNGRQRNRHRQMLVLGEMLSQGWIDQTEYDAAVAQELVFKSGIADEDRWVKCTNEDCGYENIRSAYVLENANYFCPKCSREVTVDKDASLNVYPWFVDAALEDVAKELAEQDGVTWNDATARNYKSMLSRCGYHIYTTLDMEVQKQVDTVYTNTDNMPKIWNATQQLQSAIVVIDNSTGDVVALSGGVGEKTDFLGYNRATQAKRQPGSTFKILSTYAPALDTAGYTLASVVKDEPYKYANGRPVTNAGGGYSGNLTLRKAIEKSTNVVAVKVFTAITPQLGYDYLLDFGISTLVESRVSGNDTYTDIQQATALGGITDGVTNLEMTAAYAAIADGGLYHEPTLYTVVYDYDGRILLDNLTTATKQVIKETIAYLLTNAMKDVVTGTNGTGKLCNIPDMTEAGKTGTTSNTYDVWFCGYTPYLTASIWSGYDENTQLGNASYHKKMWKTIMQEVHEYYGYEDTAFEVPNGVAEYAICKSSGNLAGEGCATKKEYYATGTEPSTLCTLHVPEKKPEVPEVTTDTEGETTGDPTTANPTSTPESGTMTGTADTID